MAANESTSSGSCATDSFERKITLRLVTAIMAAVVGLTFLFGFGNVWTLALRLGVPPWVAPLVAPAVDLSVVGLLLGTRYLALRGASREQLRPARRLLVFSSLMTLALNVTDPLLAGQLGKAAFDAVGPLLLIGWAEVGPGLLQAISSLPDGPSGALEDRGSDDECRRPALGSTDARRSPFDSESAATSPNGEQWNWRQSREYELLERARQEDARHWEEFRRPISAETLRKRLRVGAARARMLVAVVRSGYGERTAVEVGGRGARHSVAANLSS
ncbi:SpdA protein [Streptomyces sp. NPDC046909]|uniref:SpdA protein n=1 Tax=Streptomyces sp. NPDC046909 TaxID=3155617 RepID=UPI0033DD39A3